MKDESSIFFFLTCASFFATEIILFRKMGGGCVPEQAVMPYEKKNLKLVRCLCFSILGLALIMMYLQLGVPSLRALIIDEIYDLRQSYQISRYTNYILYVATQVCIPFAIADGYVRKSKIQILLIILIQLVFFLWTGHKTWFFSIFLMLGIIILLKHKKSIDYLFVALTILCAVGYYGNDNLIINKGVTSLINRRVLLDPAALKFSYYDYFIVKGHSPNLVSGTVFAPLFRSIATEGEDDYTFKISEIYTDASSNAGTGLYGGDIASVGIFVFFMVPIALLFISSLTKRTEHYMGRDFTLLLLVYIFFSFNDQRIIQYLLDIRGVFLIIILYLFSRRQQSKNLNAHL